MNRQDAAFAANPMFHVVSLPKPGETEGQRALRIFQCREQPEPFNEFAKLAAHWRRRNRLPAVELPWRQMYVPYIRSRSVAAAFNRLVSRPYDPTILAAYAELARQTDQQFTLLEIAGLRFEFVFEAEPYPTAVAQAHDVVHNARLKTATIACWPESHHPLLSNERGGSYDRFRAVHDAFGHIAIGTGFDRHGEFGSWLHHSSMFYGIAQCAASTELTGENSFLAVTGNFPTHKAAILPSRFHPGVFF